MNRAWLALVPLLPIGLIAAGAALRPAAIPAPETREAPLVLTGRDSRVLTPTIELARTQQQLDRLWSAHAADRIEHTAQGAPITPRVDFSSHAALLIFGGDSVNANGYTVRQLIESPDQITVRYQRDSYQTASFDGVDHGDPVRPWALVLIPNNDRPVRLERNTQGMRDPDPIWTHQQTFPAP